MKFFEVFSYTFMAKAFLVGIFISAAMALLGISLVLKRYSMIGDGLAHVGFSAHTIALSLNWVPVFFSIPVVIIFAMFLMWIGENSKIKGDALIALISTSFLSIGIVVVSLTTGMNTSVLNYMFGSVLAINDNDLILSLICSTCVILFFLIYYNKIFIITFDENFAKAIGINLKFYSGLTAILVSVMIVVGMKIVGALLISSLIVFPAMTAMKIFKTFKLVAIGSVFFSVFCYCSGLFLAYNFSLPVGAAVVLVNLIVFLFIYIFTILQGVVFKI